MNKKQKQALEAEKFAVALHEAEVKIIGCVIGFNLVGKATRRRIMSMSDTLRRIRFGLEHYTVDACPDAPIEKWSLSSNALMSRGLIDSAILEPEQKTEINKMFVSELLCEQKNLESLTDKQIKDISNCIVDSGASFDNLK